MYRNMPNRRFLPQKKSNKNFDLNIRRGTFSDTFKESEEFKRFYRSYRHMKVVTECTTNRDFHLYGGRGIKSDAYFTFEVFFDEQWEKYMKAVNEHGKVTMTRKHPNGDFNFFNIQWVAEPNHKRTTILKWFELVDPKGNRKYANNVSKVAKEIGCKSQDIRKCLNKVRLSHQGYIFRYLTDQEIINLNLK